MGGRVVIALTTIGGLGQTVALVIHDNGSDGHFSGCSSLSGEGDRPLHPSTMLRVTVRMLGRSRELMSV
jgi:hypothetical protein